MDGWYPKAERLPITTGEYNVPRGAQLVGIVNHITDGTDSRGWLQHANNRSSVHFLIRAEGGKGVVYQFMPVHYTAWGNGRHSGLSTPNMPNWVKDLIRRGININHATVSIEHERKWPFSTMLEGPMVDASIELHRWLVANYATIKPTREMVIGHYQIDVESRAHCPGGPGGRFFPFERIISAIGSGPQPIPSPVPPTSRYYPETERVVGGSILRYFLTNGEIVQFGFPVTGELRERLQDGQEHTVQYFQRARLEWHPGSQPDVMLGLVGAELLRARGEQPGRFLITSPDFQEAYSRFGGIAKLGHPVTPEQQEKLSDGNTYTVQYTERGRLERHQLADGRSVVMMGLVGYELAKVKGLVA